MLKSVSNLMANIKNNSFPKLHLIGFVLIYLILNYGSLVRQESLPESLLDASWIIGLNWASFLNLRWLDNSVVFTYGPLYYLNGLLIPEFHSPNFTILINFGLNLFYAGCFTYIYLLFTQERLEVKGKRIWLTVTVVLMLFYQERNIDLIPLFVDFIFLPIIFSAKNTKTNLKQYIRYGIIALLLATIPFIKFTHVYESLLVILIMVGFLLYRRKYIDAMLIGILFVIFTILVWVFSTGESVFSLLPYLASRFSISSGYTEVMLTGAAENVIYQIFSLALLFLTVLMVVFIYLFFTKRWTWLIAWTLPMITLFLGFKSAFVRSDHAMIFLGYVFIAVLYYFYLLKRLNLDKNNEFGDLAWRKSAARFLIPSFVLIVLSTFYLLGGRLLIVNQFLAASNLFNPSIYNPIPRQEALKKTYNLDSAFLDQINTKKTIDIIPWDIALLHAYNFHWTPRPIIQSYASYTATLDNLDADFFKNSASPKQLIYSLATIDGRYSVFDTPHTFRVLLDKYQLALDSQNESYTFLKQREYTLSRNLISIDQKEYSLNQNIPIPMVQVGHIFMSAEIEPTLTGKFLNIIYKPTISYVEMTLNTGEKVRHRLIRDTAKNGLFVSVYVKNLADLRSVFNETYKQNIASIRFIADGWLYDTNIRVHFYKIPFSY